GHGGPGGGRRAAVAVGRDGGGRRCWLGGGGDSASAGEHGDRRDQVSTRLHAAPPIKYASYAIRRIRRVVYDGCSATLAKMSIAGRNQQRRASSHEEDTAGRRTLTAPGSGSPARSRRHPRDAHNALEGPVSQSVRG